MNILVDLFRCFSLLVLASSLRVKEIKYRGNQAPVIWTGPNIYAPENPEKSREVNENDDEFNHDISDYGSFRNVHQIPQLNRDELHNAREMKQNIPGTFPRRNPGVITNIGSFISHIKPYPFPGQEEVAQMNLNNLLCITECRMAEFMMFNMNNQPGNVSFPFQTKALPGRPYSPASLRTWCQNNCGKRSSWKNPNLKNDELEGKGIHAKKSIEEYRELEDEKSATSNAGIPYIPFGAKPPGLIQPIPPVIPTIVFPPVRNFYPYPNIITTSLVYSRTNDKPVENTEQTSGVSFRSLRDNSPKTVAKRKYYPNRIYQRSKFKGLPYPGIAEYRAFRDSIKHESDTEIPREEEEPHQSDDGTEKQAGEGKYDERNYSYEDENLENDFDDDDESEEGISSIIKFLREVSRILSNKSFRVFLKKSISCDPKRNTLPEKDRNNTDFHRRANH